MISMTDAMVIAAAKVRFSQDNADGNWDDLPSNLQDSYCAAARAIVEAAAGADKIYAEEHVISARIWRRRDEWVLELNGGINDCGFSIRHTQPGSLSPEDALGLPTHYAWEERLIAAGLPTEHVEPEAAPRNR